MDMIGETMGSYRIVRKLGEGGMGVVYLAEHPLIGKKAAVKMLLPELSNNEDIVHRFFNEAKATTQLNHPGIVEVFDFGHHASGSAFIVMEFLEGESLGARLAREHRLSENLAIELTHQVASAVSAAHAKGIIHRDLKPDNVYLLAAPDVPCGIRTKVLDFGIAKLTSGTTAEHQTRAGLVLGTCAYMSPEQCKASTSIDARSDIYALGCILIEMLLGAPPYLGAPYEVIAAHLSAPLPPLEERGIDPALAAVIRRMMAKDPAERYPSMSALCADLDALVATRKSSGAVFGALVVGHNRHRRAPGGHPAFACGLAGRHRGRGGAGARAGPGRELALAGGGRRAGAGGGRGGGGAGDARPTRPAGSALAGRSDGTGGQPGAECQAPRAGRGSAPGESPRRGRAALGPRRADPGRARAGPPPHRVHASGRARVSRGRRRADRQDAAAGRPRA